MNKVKFEVAQDICKRGYDPDDAALIVQFADGNYWDREADPVFRKLVDWYREWSDSHWKPKGNRVEIID